MGAVVHNTHNEQCGAWQSVRNLQSCKHMLGPPTVHGDPQRLWSCLIEVELACCSLTDLVHAGIL